MLKKLSSKKSPSAHKAGGYFAIVASRYNTKYVESMLKAAHAELKRAGVDGVEIIRVPGAFEIPVVAASLSRRLTPRVSAILCLGVILRGATSHAQQVGESVSQALLSIQMHTLIPVIHEVLLLENEQQAKERCLDPQRNRGLEAAQTALTMAKVMLSVS